MQAIKASRFWEHRRPTHLLTGLVRCAHCGGEMTSVGRDYLACANARKLDRCDQRKAIRRAVLEEFVLDLIRDRMMQPDAVKAFVAAYTQEINAGREAPRPSGRGSKRELAALTAKLDGLYDAIADGLRIAGTAREDRGARGREGAAGGRSGRAGALAGAPAPEPRRALPREGRRACASRWPTPASATRRSASCAG